MDGLKLVEHLHDPLRSCDDTRILCLMYSSGDADLSADLPMLNGARLAFAFIHDIALSDLGRMLLDDSMATNSEDRRNVCCVTGSTDAVGRNVILSGSL